MGNGLEGMWGRGEGGMRWRRLAADVGFSGGGRGNRVNQSDFLALDDRGGLNRA